MFDPGRWRTLLLPLSWPYQLGVSLRNRHYDRSPDAVRRASVPVISVGNITVGGTGKTPMVVQVVRCLRDLGRRPVILTRGYRQQAGQQADEVLVFANELGDEVPVVVDGDRCRGARFAVREHAGDVLVMDDGMQHRRLHRDLNLVLIDALDPWGGGALLPAGRLREPLSSLSRADAFIVTRANQVAPEELRAVRDELIARFDRSVWLADIEVCGLESTAGDPPAVSDLAYDTVLPVSGLGNPNTFEQLVGQLAGHTLAPLRYADHHPYGTSDVGDILARARDLGAQRVLTTTKDWVKLRPLWEASGDALPLVAVRVALRLRDPDALRERLEQLLAGG